MEPVLAMASFALRGILPERKARREDSSFRYDFEKQRCVPAK
jgi:hypothetical protein